MDSGDDNDNDNDDNIVDLTLRVDFSVSPPRCCTAFGIPPPTCRWVRTAEPPPPPPATKEADGAGDDEERAYRHSPARGVNCAQIDGYTPHACGTHTESVLHVLPAEHYRRVVGCAGALPPPLGFYRGVLLRVGTVTLTKDDAEACAYASARAGDTVVALRDALQGIARARRTRAAPERARAVTVLVADYAEESARGRALASGRSPPYFLPRDIIGLRAAFPRMRHLLVNVPSLDRADDRGLLLSHRAYWARELSDMVADAACEARCTLTELIRAPSAEELARVAGGGGGYDAAASAMDARAWTAVTVCIATAPVQGMDAVPSSVYLMPPSRATT